MWKQRYYDRFCQSPIPRNGKEKRDGLFALSETGRGQGCGNELLGRDCAIFAFDQIGNLPLSRKPGSLFVNVFATFHKEAKLVIIPPTSPSCSLTKILAYRDFLAHIPKRSDHIPKGSDPINAPQLTRYPCGSECSKRSSPKSKHFTSKPPPCWARPAQAAHPSGPTRAPLSPKGGYLSRLGSR